LGVRSLSPLLLERGPGVEVALPSPLRRGVGGEVQWDTGTRGIAHLRRRLYGLAARGTLQEQLRLLPRPHSAAYSKGIRYRVAQLERTPEKGYLDPYKVIFLSYDILKR